MDRRRFTADGEVRDLPEQSAPAEPVEAHVQDLPVPPPPRDAENPAMPEASPSLSAPPTDEPPWPDSTVGFADLVDLLATQAYSHLTGQGTGRGPDPRSARVFIDFLGILQDKTKGRLSAQEERLLDDVLYQLRTLFLAPPR